MGIWRPFGVFSLTGISGFIIRLLLTKVVAHKRGISITCHAYAFSAHGCLAGNSVIIHTRMFFLPYIWSACSGICGFFSKT